MTICQLGAEWHDPTKIPVEEIAEEWRTQSTKGRYESAMWREAGLQEPNAGLAGKAQGGQSSSNRSQACRLTVALSPASKPSLAVLLSLMASLLMLVAQKLRVWSIRNRIRPSKLVRGIYITRA